MAIQDQIRHHKLKTLLFHSKMEKSIQMAKSVLCDIFGINSSHFEKHTSRSQHIIEARRFLIYYLFSECGIKHLHMKKHIPALKNHATSIYHYKKMKELMEMERPTEREYEIGFFIRYFLKRINDKFFIEINIITTKEQ